MGGSDICLELRSAFEAGSGLGEGCVGLGSELVIRLIEVGDFRSYLAPTLGSDHACD